MNDEDPHPLTDAGERSFRQHGVPDDERDRWLKAGFGPFAAINHRKLGMTPEQSVLARAHGVSSNDIARDLSDGTSLADVLAALDQDPHFSPSERRRLGMAGYDHAALLIAEEFDMSADGLAMIDRGQFDLLVPAMRLGAPIDDALDAVTAGLDPRELVAWLSGSGEPDHVAAGDLAGEFTSLCDSVGLSSAEFLDLMQQGFTFRDIRRAMTAGADHATLLALVHAGNWHDSWNPTVESDALALVLGLGARLPEVNALVAISIRPSEIHRAMSHGASLDDVPWVTSFPDHEVRAAWRAACSNASDAARWSRYGIRPADLVDGAPNARMEEQRRLIAAITSIDLDITTDYPCQYQVGDNRDGLFEVSYRHLDDDGIFDGSIDHLDMTFLEILQVASEEGVRRIDLNGLTLTKAIRLLELPRVLPATTRVFESSTGVHDPIYINRCALRLQAGHLVKIEGD